MSLPDKDLKVFEAKLSEQAERYDEMVEAMKAVALSGDAELSVEERNLFSVAYKNVIGTRRASWRVLVSIEQREEQKSPDSTRLPLMKKFKEQVEHEMKKISNEVVDILEKNLIPNTKTAEAQVFFHKMRGDYHRYLAEFLANDEREAAAEKSLEAYKAASKIAEAELSTTHPIRLGLALNFSVFYYEIKNSAEQACSLAKRAFDEAIADLDNLPEDSYKDSTLIMQLLRDNLTLWTSDLPQEDNADDGKKA